MRSWVGVLLAGTAALAVSGCFEHDRSLVKARPDDTSGSWRVEHEIDRITGHPITSASVITRVTNNTKGLQTFPAAVSLICSRGRLYVQFEFGLRVGAERNSTLAYRVDDRLGAEAEVSFLQDHKTVHINEPQAVAKFVADVSPGSMLLVRTSSPFGGRTFGEFRIVGAAAAFAPLLEACPLPAGSPGKHAGAARRADAGPA
ncbi:hypothetical protein [Rhodoplanes roseus]|uniref:Uncharacterized protein n=1 Tax=Rhodoplanes roseus TaxID=29409 RepID=A0A327KK73_9BRAD|nr:hypothetical protein [Rhodoplanes roseus]RAI39210.1 hypothetical protein CH341_26330 [Rhodoplanes roseus]